MMKRRDRFRFWLMRTCAMLGGHFAIYDQEDDRIAHDSRKLNGKAGANAGE